MSFVEKRDLSIYRQASEKRKKRSKNRSCSPVAEEISTIFEEEPQDDSSAEDQSDEGERIDMEQADDGDYLTPYSYATELYDERSPLDNSQDPSQPTPFGSTATVRRCSPPEYVIPEPALPTPRTPPESPPKTPPRKQLTKSNGNRSATPDESQPQFNFSQGDWPVISEDKVLPSPPNRPLPALPGDTESNTTKSLSSELLVAKGIPKGYVGMNDNRLTQQFLTKSVSVEETGKPKWKVFNQSKKILDENSNPIEKHSPPRPAFLNTNSIEEKTSSENVFSPKAPVPPRDYKANQASKTATLPSPVKPPRSKKTSLPEDLVDSAGESFPSTQSKSKTLPPNMSGDFRSLLGKVKPTYRRPLPDIPQEGYVKATIPSGSENNSKSSKPFVAVRKMNPNQTGGKHISDQLPSKSPIPLVKKTPPPRPALSPKVSAALLNQAGSSVPIPTARKDLAQPKPGRQSPFEEILYEEIDSDSSAILAELTKFESAAQRHQAKEQPSNAKITKSPAKFNYTPVWPPKKVTPPPRPGVPKVENAKLPNLNAKVPPPKSPILKSPKPNDLPKLKVPKQESPRPKSPHLFDNSSSPRAVLKFGDIQRTVVKCGENDQIYAESLVKPSQLKLK